MDLVVYSQYYCTRTPDRQQEIDECLRRNLNHPGISRMVLFCESDAPPVPQGSVPVEVVSSDERITYAECFRWVQRQGSGIGLQLNALFIPHRRLVYAPLAMRRNRTSSSSTPLSERALAFTGTSMFTILRTTGPIGITKQLIPTKRRQ